MHQPLRDYILNVNQVTEDCCEDKGMGESIYCAPKGFFNDGSDFSDSTSFSIACSASTTPFQFDKIKPLSIAACQCQGCAKSPYLNETPRRRKRRVFTKSLVLDHGYHNLAQYSTGSGFSDSGLTKRRDRNPQDTDSSSSDCTNITPVRVVRRKPKSYRRSMPPSYSSVKPRVLQDDIPYTWVSK